MSQELYIPPHLRNNRMNLAHEIVGHSHSRQEGVSQQKNHIEQDLHVEADEEDELNDCAIEELPGGLFQLKLQVPDLFYGGLMGYKGQTKRRIQTETGTAISIPSKNANGRENENVVLKGPSRSSVCAARRQLNLLVQTMRRNMECTHVLEVPLHSGVIRENFVKFKQRVLEANLTGIEETLFHPETRLNIVFTVCVLLNDAERARAKEMLQSCRQFLHDLHPPFQVKISGLEIKEKDPTSVRFVYAHIDAPELQIFGERCLKPLLQSGLSKVRDWRFYFKMRMKVLKAKYLKRLDSMAPDFFNAKEVLDRFGDFDFGTVQINEIHLSIKDDYIEDGPNRGCFKIFSKLQF